MSAQYTSWGEAEVRCQCGVPSGRACLWRGPRADTVMVEYRPPWEPRQAQVRWPCNGSERLRVSRVCALKMLLNYGLDVELVDTGGQHA